MLCSLINLLSLEKISPTISGTKTAKKIAQHKKSKVNKEPANDDTIKLVDDIKTAIEENKVGIEVCVT